MKYLYLNIFLAVILILLFSNLDYSNAYLIRRAPTPTPIPTATPTPTITPTPTPTQAPPVRLKIAKLGIDSLVEPVGVNEIGAMEAPKSWNNAGWYLGAAKPGEAGTAFIDGHFDDQNGAPAIFFYLRNLAAGDSISITDALGYEHIFNITAVGSVARDAVIDNLKLDNGKKNLILITCTGWWDLQAHSYTDRLVVYATME